MAAIKLDLAQLSSFCAFPEQSFSTLLDAPTVELVRELLYKIGTKSHEYDELASEKLKIGVELENAVRGGETKARILKNSVEKTAKEATEFRDKLKDEENARVSIESELQRLKTSASQSTSELSTQKTRIFALESSNRDTLSLLEAKTTAYDDLAGQLNVQHQKTIELRREVSTIEQSVQSANSASNTAKFHEQGLRQEIESLKRNNDWLDKELKTKSAEYTKYRKEKSLRIAELQRGNDESQSAIDAASRTETNLRRRLDEISQKADESFSKIQQLQEEAAKKEEAFRIELDAANRLTELTRNSASTERARQQDLSAQLELTQEEARDQLSRAYAEIDTEHRDKEAAEGKVAELEVTVEQLEAKLSASQVRQSEDSGHQGINGFSTPNRGTATPRGSPGTPRLKGAMSLTQMYSSYNDLKAELDTERARTAKLDSTVNGMMLDLQKREPEIEELRSDHIRLESEVTDLSCLLDTIGKERDQALQAAKKWEGQVEAKVREGEVLRQQLRDLSSQVKVFLMEVHLRNEGYENLSAEAKAQLERLAQGQGEGEMTEGMTDTDRFIGENLVTFRSIGELQEQNTNLLRITRELGEKMEHEEAVRKQLEETQDWEDLQQKYERCKDEIKALVTQSQSYIRERDMFRRMLTHRGQIPPGVDANSMFDESVRFETASNTPGRERVMNSVEDSPSARDLADYAKLYKEMQVHFDAYRTEAATDRSTLKEQVDSISKLNGELRSEVVRSNSQVTLAHERYEMLQANYSMLRNENAELQKRSQSLSDGAARQEVRVQQVAEDLVEAKGLIDSMRNETASLKVEKDFWRTVERRLTEDNENLSTERSRLNSLNANLQNLLNERERSDNEARRVLQGHTDNLEKDLHATKQKLSEEIEENRRIVQRREFDTEQSQKRVDDLVSSLGNIREQLVAATTTKDHLSAKVDELSIELRSAEERIKVLQRAPAERPSTTNDDDSQDLPTDSNDHGFSKAQQLAVQTSELKRDLDLAKAEVENAKGQIEQYKAISQASEDELQSLNETQDMYRQEVDQLIAKKDLRIKELEQRVEDTTSELASTNSELTALRNEQAENARRLEDHKKAFEVELAQLKDQDDRHAAAAQYYQEDLKAQADIAQQAQQNYENELVKHADAAKTVNKVRMDYNDLKLEMVEVKTEAESARTNLAQNEESIRESRERYERELAELKAARENLRAQNDRLHQHLESVTAQISNLKKRASIDEEPQNAEPPQAGLDNLQEVIKYLRREKEIVDVQLELSVQEGKRLKQQLDYTQFQLDDTRLRLNQQRRVEANNERTSLDHNKLMETINELNTFRESSVTLRAETRQAQAALATRTAEVEELKAKLEPVEAEILELKNEKETQEGEMKLLKENAERWQQRAQNVLQKYDRVDPAELEALQEQLKTLVAERDELLATKQSLQDQADQTSAQISQVQEQSNEKMETMKTRLTDQFKARSRDQTNKIKEKDAALQTATSEKQRLEQQLSELSRLQAEIDSVRAERDAAFERLGAQATESNQKMANGSEDGQVSEDAPAQESIPDLASLQDRISGAEAQASAEASQSASLRSQLDESNAKVAELHSQAKRMQESIQFLNAELADLRAQKQAHSSSGDEVEQQLAKLQEDLAQAHEEADGLRASASVNSSNANEPALDGYKPVAEQIAEHVQTVRAELEAKHKERVKEVDEALEKRTNTMKAQLTKKLTEGKVQIRQNLIAEHEETVTKLKAQHDEEMDKLRTTYEAELADLRQTETTKIEKLQADFKTERQTLQKSDSTSGVKAEGEAPSSPWKPSESEARSFMQSNDVAKSITRRIVATHVTKAKDEVTTQLKEEHEKAMIEAQNKANTAKEHAVMMEGKKTALQINMANNKFRLAHHKIGIVEKAVEETPQKPVKEVWDIAKNSKPPPAAAPQPQQSTANPQQAPAAATPGQAVFPASNAGTTQPKPAPKFLGQGTLTGQNNIQQQQQQTTQTAQPTGQARGGTFGRPSPAVLSAQAAMPSEQESPATQKPVLSESVPSAMGSEQRPPQNQNTQAPQQRDTQSAGTPHPNAGTGPAALKGLQQSGLPVARGGATRGNPNARGRGSGIGRGGPQGLNTNHAQQQGRNSPTGPGMNPGARQFVPGNKRPRDDEHHLGDVNQGKRIRGGGGGS